MSAFQSAHGESVVAWLRDEVVGDARGDALTDSPTNPAGRFWLGRLAPEQTGDEPVAERGQRMAPSATGIRLKVAGQQDELVVRVSFAVWTKAATDLWVKSEPINVSLAVAVPSSPEPVRRGEREIRSAIEAVAPTSPHAAAVEIEVEERAGDLTTVALTLVNTTRPDAEKPTEIFESRVSVSDPGTEPFVLEGLADSFRYDRTIAAEGINGGVQRRAGQFETTDWVSAERSRPTYWDESLGTSPDLSFSTLAADPLPQLCTLVDRADEWGRRAWSSDVLEARADEEDWTAAMRDEASKGRKAFEDEVAAMRDGIELLSTQPDLLRAYQLMNAAMAWSARQKPYSSWRPFQVGYQLVVLPSLLPEASERSVVDTLWFATGGGKTETYLGVVATACLFDRIRGKRAGVTAWSRFPLRMLSLQQMQRFADVLAGAEVIRQREKLGGDPFRLGFLVGSAASPNRIRTPETKKEFDHDASDPTLAETNRRLDRCPFCGGTDIAMTFDERYWVLAHACENDECPWTGPYLPVHVVDEEVFRFLPSVVVGTLDKAAAIGFSAAFRGMVGAPLGKCTGKMHGYVYATRSDKPTGCLVPGCDGRRYKAGPLGQAGSLFAPTLRVQDELHLLRDSLGAVDAQYETTLDHLSASDGAGPAKIIASSATLNGHDRQVDALYQRVGRVFPQPGPVAGDTFWTRPTSSLLRAFVGLAPRGQTLEYAHDRIALVLQSAIRRLLDPVQREALADEIGVPIDAVDRIADLYGTHVVYGTRLRDVEAAVRSFRSEVPLDPLNYVTLTSGTDFDEVRRTLTRLSDPEAVFGDRVHLVAASSMMSHGVDIDRLNVITMLGLPLTTAEFIQTTARIGRTHPGLVFVLHRMGGERDASVYRAFETWVEHGDRFVEPIPITRRSRRVLDVAFPGVLMARLLAVHERQAQANGDALTTTAAVRRYFEAMNIDEQTELAAVAQSLGIDVSADPQLADDLKALVSEFFRALEERTDIRSPSDLLRHRPMLSLRDVEPDAPVVEDLSYRGRTRS